MSHRWADLSATVRAAEVPNEIDELLATTDAGRAGCVFDYIENNLCWPVGLCAAIVICTHEGARQRRAELPKTFQTKTLKPE